MTIEENDNPGGTFQFKNDTAIYTQVSSKFKNTWLYKIKKMYMYIG